MSHEYPGYDASFMVSFYEFIGFPVPFMNISWEYCLVVFLFL